MCIVLDYGHGGRDVGAIFERRKESEDTYRFGKMLAQKLKNLQVPVYETRTGNAFVSLRQRVAFSDSKKPLYFISIHRNASSTHKACGAETFIYPNSRAVDLAETLQRELVASGFRHRGVKRASYYVLKHTTAPAILLEVGFIDCAEDNRLFDRQMDSVTTQLAIQIAYACTKKI